MAATASAVRKEKRVKPPRQKITLKTIKKQKELIFLAIPFVLYVIIFNYLPLGGWLMAFENYKPKDGLLHSTFVGLDKFKFLFANDVQIGRAHV